MTPRELDISDRRLERLCKLLDELPRKRFHYDTWVGPEWQGSPDLSCGTTACAGGWATTIPAFRRLGLRAVRRGEHNDIVLRRGARNLYSFDALERLFDITYWEARYLFSPSNGVPASKWRGLGALKPIGPGIHATPKAVAKHIRAFIRARRRLARSEAA